MGTIVCWNDDGKKPHSATLPLFRMVSLITSRPQASVGEKLPEPALPGVIAPGSLVAGFTHPFGGVWVDQVIADLLDQLLACAIGVDLCSDLVEPLDLI